MSAATDIFSAVQALREALPALRAYQAYGWPDRHGVIRRAEKALAEIEAKQEAPSGDKVLDELRAAHLIIRNTLAVMTTEQKVRLSELNARDGVDGEGVTRANEREAVIAEALHSQAQSCGCASI